MNTGPVSFFVTKSKKLCLHPVTHGMRRPDGRTRGGPIRWNSFLAGVLGVVFGGVGLSGPAPDGVLENGAVGGNSNQPAHREREREHGYSYFHDSSKVGPLSIHVFKLDRSRHDWVLANTLGNGRTLGMSTVSDQLKLLPPASGKPLAAVNGDFYFNDSRLPGDPRDLQIHEGELISAPSGHACFWIDPSGEFQSTNVFSRFRVVWPDQSTTPIGLNEVRDNDSAVLYTAAAGAATPAGTGTELILESTQDGSWLPLRVGQVFRARVKAVRSGGETFLNRETAVLSLGPKLAAKAVPLAQGAVIQLVTETIPSLTGVTLAIGGGPTLVRSGKPMEWSGFLMRHPRTAIGWTREFCFLVEVDGRQNELSIGMTFPELAAYLVKLGCQEAMNLDGGGSATMWVLGQVINSPSEGHERPGANALVVLPNPSPSPDAAHRSP